MKKLIFIIASFVALNVSAQTKVQSSSDGVYKAITTTKEHSKPVDTGKVFQDAKGVKYPIYQSEKGKHFILRTSAKSGKQYRYYIQF